MGILSRFGDIIKSNVNDMLDKCEDPAKMVDQYLRNLTENLAEVKKETAGVMAEETRTRRMVEENSAEIAKYRRPGPQGSSGWKRRRRPGVFGKEAAAGNQRRQPSGHL